MTITFLITILDNKRMVEKKAYSKDNDIKVTNYILIMNFIYKIFIQS